MIDYSKFEGHTPEPWFAVERSTNPITYSVGVQVPIRGNLVTTHYIAHVSDGRKSAESDACLIAAAPELLAENKSFREALQDIADGCIYPRSIANSALQEAKK